MDVIIQETLSVPGVDCAGCARRVKATLSALPGVTTVQVSVNKQTVTVTYDERIVSRDQLDARLGANGYPVARAQRGKPLPIHALAVQPRGSARATNVPVVSRAEYLAITERRRAAQQ